MLAVLVVLAVPTREPLRSLTRSTRAPRARRRTRRSRGCSRTRASTSGSLVGRTSFWARGRRRDRGGRHRPRGLRRERPRELGTNEEAGALVVVGRCRCSAASSGSTTTRSPTAAIPTTATNHWRTASSYEPKTPAASRRRAVSGKTASRCSYDATPCGDRGPTVSTNERVLEMTTAPSRCACSAAGPAGLDVADSADAAASDGVGLSSLLPPSLVPGSTSCSQARSASTCRAGVDSDRWSPSPARLVGAAESTRAGRRTHPTGDRQHAALILAAQPDGDSPGTAASRAAPLSRHWLRPPRPSPARPARGARAAGPPSGHEGLPAGRARPATDRSREQVHAP